MIAIYMILFGLILFYSAELYEGLNFELPEDATEEEEDSIIRNRVLFPLWGLILTAVIGFILTAIEII